MMMAMTAIFISALLASGGGVDATICSTRGIRPCSIEEYFL